MEHALSVGQNALWLIHRMAPETAAYNVAWPMRVRGPLDVPALLRAVAMTVERHDMLRSLFTEIAGVPGRVLQDGLVGLDVRDARGADDARLTELVQAEIARPFKLDIDGAARFVLFKMTSEDAVLLFVVHHIATDFASLTLVVKDLLEAYRAVREARDPDWAPLAHTYADFVAAEQRLLESPRAEEMAAYWRSALRGAPATLELALDHPRPARQRFQGAGYRFQLPQDVVDGIFHASRKARVTPVRHMLGVFQALLYRCSAQHDFLIGCDSQSSMGLANRGVPGYYSNKIVLRAQCTTATTFRDLITDVNTQMSGAMANVDFPFAMLHRALGLPSRAGTQALAQVSVSMITVDPRDELVSLANLGEGHEVAFDELRLSALDLPQQVGQTDLVLEVVRSRDSVRCVLKYDTDLFTAASIQRMATHYERLLRAAAADPGQRVASVSLVDESERARLLAFATGRRPAEGDLS
ncbi:hypothetical protein Lesp02_12970 [Lentzea sp. NBRC 105346]|uniref:condensation domain-containing protein n=1 Tax=Lentzea sp. NBRC 105346 TaxID=3032205 RepID=UPI0024A2ED1E|nr:condensation domain-containing protein [Lentzea sp. NBRC 105346]GLZ29107.1 hypothetical protein Lesp02_12970 [Lentzea sp. NBRC 105346]